MEIQNIDLVIRGMIAHDAGHPHFIQHFLKVHEFARLIGIGENLENRSVYVGDCCGCP